MDRMIVHSRVGADGVLNLVIPIGKAEADTEIQVTIEPLPRPALTQEEWRKFVLSTAGAWQGDLERPEQGEYEQRDELP